MEKPTLVKQTLCKNDPMFDNLEQQDNLDGVPMCLHKGFWYPNFVLRGLLLSGEHFKANDTDIVLASQPKAGTTWMKALLFSIINRHQFPIHESPLLTTSPHRLVDPLECFYYFLLLENPDLHVGSDPPRLYSTHLPYQHLPISLVNSKCKIVYIARNPLDQFISEREFLLKIRMNPDFEPLPIAQAFDMFCRGVHAFGPYSDHFLGYWNASLENPDRILFLKYEDLKMDPISNIEKIADFLGCPFSEEERKSDLMEEIFNTCSFDSLKNLEVNKTGVHYGSILNDVFYRKGDIGDWKNHITPSMAQRLKQMMSEKMSAYGLNLYEGFWYPNYILRGMLLSGEHFKADDTDSVLASQPKAGTTWMKALLFSIINRHQFPIHESPLLTTSPHKLIELLEFQYYFLLLENPDLRIGTDPPHLYATHLPYQHLLASLLDSKCKIVYITRNPLDQFISYREFLLKVRMNPDFEPLPLAQAFDMFCRGVQPFGPSSDHILGYWNASLENPDRILFHKYEDLKMDPVSSINKIADFLGRPFSEEERKNGVSREISNLCRFDNLKNLQVNKTGVLWDSVKNEFFYRKGEIEDWKNHITPSMAERLKQMMSEKMSASGLC